MFNILILLATLFLYSSCVEITKVGDAKALVGLSPFYDADKDSLIYVDSIGSFVFKPSLYRHDFATNTTYAAKLEGLPISTKLGFVIPFENSTDLYAIGAGRNFEVVQWDGVSKEAKLLCTQMEIDPIESNFVHSAHVDSKGRVWTETLRNAMCDKESKTLPGSIFMSSDAKTMHPVIKNKNIPNDFIFDEERNLMYYGDSCVRQIKVLDFDPETGGVSNERVVYDDSYSPDATPITAPDGVTVDQKGNLWVTGNGQSIVYNVDVNNGNRVKIIRIPGIFSQSITWGGPNYDTLFVTTDKAVYSVENGKILKFKAGPEDGYIYQIKNVGAKGQPERKVGLKYASCMNDPAALAAQKKRESLKSKIKRLGTAANIALHRGQPY